MKKLIKRLVLAAIIVPIIVVVGGLYYIDVLAKTGVERGATYALGVPTTLDSLSVGVLSGTLSLAELSVANPPGFGDEPFLRLGEGRVAVTLGSLMEDTVELPELKLTGIQMSLEKKGDSSNYQTILKGLDKFESSGDAPATDAEDGKKFVVRLVSVEDINVAVDVLPIGGELTRIPLHIERIELRDIGSDSDGGVLLSQLTDILVKAILEAIVREGGGILPNVIAGELSSGLAALDGLGQASLAVIGDVTTLIDGEVRKIGDLGGALLGDVGKTEGGLGKGLRETSDALGKGVGKLGEGLGDLLGGKKSNGRRGAPRENGDER